VTDAPNSLNDGVARYASRTRVNREVIEFTQSDLAGNNTATKTLPLNGKIARIVLDPSRVVYGGAATTGSLKITMNIEDSAGNEYPYCDTLSVLNFRTDNNAPLNFQTSEGGNMNADGGATSGLHLTVTAPTSSKTGGIVIDEPAPWNGLVCDAVSFTVAVSASTFDASTGTMRLIVIYE